MNKELDKSGNNPAKKSTTHIKSASEGDFRDDKEDNVSSTYLENLGFVDALTVVACAEKGMLHPASPKRDQ